MKIDAEGAERFLLGVEDFKSVRRLVVEWDWTHNKERKCWEEAGSGWGAYLCCLLAISEARAVWPFPKAELWGFSGLGIPPTTVSTCYMKLVELVTCPEPCNMYIAAAFLPSVRQACLKWSRAPCFFQQSFMQ